MEGRWVSLAATEALVFVLNLTGKWIASRISGQKTNQQNKQTQGTILPEMALQIQNMFLLGQTWFGCEYNRRF